MVEQLVIKAATLHVRLHVRHFGSHIKTHWGLGGIHEIHIFVQLTALSSGIRT